MRDLPFPEAYARLLPPVRARCRRMLRSTSLADDVVQETFLRLWRAGPSLREADVATVMGWLYRTCTRLAIDVLRDDARARLQRQDASEACSSGPHELLAARECIAALQSSVPAAELEAAMLARVDGLSQPDVASILRVSERTVRRMLDRFDQQTATLRGDRVTAKARSPRVPVALVGIALALAALLAGRSCAASPEASSGDVERHESKESDR